MSIVIDDNGFKNILLDENCNVVLSRMVDEDNTNLLIPVGNVGNTDYLIWLYGESEIIELNKYYLISGDKQSFGGEDLIFKFSGDLEKLERILIL